MNGYGVIKTTLIILWDKGQKAGRIEGMLERNMHRIPFRDVYGDGGNCYSRNAGLRNLPDDIV
jgi:hypothetical protein